MEKRRNELFLIVADIILFFFIVILATLIINKKTHFIYKLRTNIVKRTQKKEIKPLKVFYISPLSAQKIDSHKEYQLNPFIQMFKEKLYFNSQKGKFFRYDNHTKSLDAVEQTLTYTSPLFLFQNNFIFKDTTNHFFKLNPDTMTLEPLFYYPTGKSLNTFPNICKINSDHYADLIFPNSYSQIVALDGKSFNPIWTFADTTASVIYSPVELKANNDSVPDFTFADENGVLYVLDGKSSWVLWKFPLQKKLTQRLYTIDINNDKKKEIIGFTQSHDLFIFDYKGDKLAEIKLQNIEDPTFLFSDFNKNKLKEILIITKKKLMVLNGLAKTALWEKNTESPFIPRTALLIDINKDKIKDVLIASKNGMLYGFNGKTGEKIFEFELEFYPFSNFIYNKGILSYISDDNYIIELKITKNK